MKFATRKYRAPYGLEQVEMEQEEKEPDTVSGEVIGIGSRRSRMQTRVGGDPEAHAHVT